MSNTHRGDVDVKAGNKIYTLRLSVGALVQLEEHFGLGINQIAQKLSNTENMRLTDWVAVMWAAMRKHQPSATQEQASELIDDLGLEEAINALGRAMQAAFPPAKGGERPSPEAEAGGTGPASSSASSR